MEENGTSISLQRWYCGDQKALDALLENHMAWIHKMVRERMGSLLREKGDTCDYVQDAVVQFLQYGPRFTISNDARFRGLLLKIVENILCNKYNWFTARRREIARERPLPTDTVLSLDPPQQQMNTPSEFAAKHEREAWIRLGIEFVSPEDREVLILREWDKLPFEEVGKRLGISSGAAQVRHFRAVSRLSKKVSALRRGDLDSV
ncbi:MAG: RNA polymerase sigma factor [Planctomycetota bacterium]|jgi:RNA polymerase sigma-70 factor (ECF subfamily)